MDLWINVTNSKFRHELLSYQTIQIILTIKNGQHWADKRFKEFDALGAFVVYLEVEWINDTHRTHIRECATNHNNDVNLVLRSCVQLRNFRHHIQRSKKPGATRRTVFMYVSEPEHCIECPWCESCTASFSPPNTLNLVFLQFSSVRIWVCAHLYIYKRSLGR